MKGIILLIIISLSVFSPFSVAKTRMNATIGHAFGAIGLLYRPASFRIGQKTWELGLLNPRFIGLNKIFNINKNLYFSIGPGIGNSNSVGIFSACGLEFLFWGFVNVRGELNASIGHKNYGHEEVILGVSLNL